MSIAAAKLNKTEVIKVYSQTAPVYDVWGILTETKARKRALELAQIVDGESILEVAVGTGLTFQEILKANPHGHSTGIDLTAAILEKARRRAAKSGSNNYSLSLGDAYDLQYPDRQFDLLMNNYMFDLLPEEDFVTVLTEFKRVLKPGGRLVLLNMSKNTPRTTFYEFVYRTIRLFPCRPVAMDRYVREAGFIAVEWLYRNSYTHFIQLPFGAEIVTAHTPE
jgi:ubiquinone/menaquinone biosynthesis C-methylase UbiE